MKCVHDHEWKSCFDCQNDKVLPVGEHDPLREAIFLSTGQWPGEDVVDESDLWTLLFSGPPPHRDRALEHLRKRRQEHE